MGLKYIWALLLLVYGMTGVAQSKKQWKKYGDLAFAGQDYQGAAIYYDKARLSDTTDIHLLKLYCEALRHANEYDLAEKLYRQLIQQDSLRQYPEAMFYLGLLQKNTGNYREAENSLRKYSTQEGLSEYTRQRLMNEIAGCELALHYSEQSGDTQPVYWIEGLNTLYAEFAPVLVYDSVMLFSSQRLEEKRDESNEPFFPVRLYQASLQELTWVTEGEFAGAINSAGIHVSNGTFTEDRRKFYFSACDQHFTCQIMVSSYDQKAWTEPYPLDNTINYPGYSTTQPFFTRIGGRDVLLFVSDRPGGKGKMDIWYALRKQEDSYYEPVNLGASVNTPEDDITPWYDTADSTLYFSSVWWPGLGGFDIFRSRGMLLHQEKAENMGTPYNSGANDVYFSIAPGQQWAYLSSNRTGSLRDTIAAFNDIWRIRQDIDKKEDKDSLETIRQFAANMVSLNEKLPLHLYFHNDQPDSGSRDTLTALDYLQSVHDYLRYRPVYLQIAGQWGRDENEKRQKIAEMQQFFDDKVSGGADRLEHFMEQLYLQLKNGLPVRLGVRAYVSPLGEKTYNRNLAMRRISSIVNYVYAYNNGCLRPFLTDSSGLLTIEQLPVLHTEQNASSVQDVAKAIYGMEAAEARRIEIAWLLPAGVDYAYMLVRKLQLPDGTGNDIGFIEFQNIGNQELLIDKVEGNGSISVQSFQKGTAPGAKGYIYFSYADQISKGKEAGNVEKNIRIFSNGFVSEKQIDIPGG